MATLREDNVIFNIRTQLDQKGIDDAKKETKGLEGTFAKAGKAFSAIVTVAGVTAAVAGLAKITKEALKQAAAFEQTSVSFKTLTGNIRDAQRLVGQLEEFSVVTPFTPEAVLQAGKTLLAFGVDAEDVADNLKNLGEASAATGGDLNNLAFIFGQARATGVLFTQDLNQLANAGLPILSLLAEEMGEAEENIRGLAAEGQITFPILQRAFARAAREGGRFEGALKAQSETLEGLKSTAEGVRNAFFRAFGQRILEPAKAFQRVMIDIWEAARDFVAVGLDEQLANERAELNVLIGRITDANTEQETRNKLIGELQDQYPDFLGNLDAESASNEEIRDRLIEVNEQYRLKIINARLSEEEADAADDLAKAIIRETDALNERQRIIDNINQGGTFLSNLNEEQLALLGATESAEEFIETLDSLLDAKQQDETFTGKQLTRLQELNAEIDRSRAKQEDLQAVVANVQRRSQEILNQLGLDIEPEIEIGGGGGGDTPGEEEIKTLAETIAETFGEEYELQIMREMDEVAEATSNAVLRAFLGRQGDDTRLISPLDILDFSFDGVDLREKFAEILGPEATGGIFDGLEIPIPEPDLGGGEGTLEDQLEKLEEAYYLLDGAAQEYFSNEQARTEELIQLQETRIRRALQTAERGNAEQLQLEEDRLNELLEKRERAAERQRQIDQLQIIAANAVAVAEGVKAVIAGFGQGPIAGIANLVALGSAIGSIVLAVKSTFDDIPAFDVGTDRLDSDMVAKVHKGERILTAEQNNALGMIPNAEIPDLVNEGLRARMDRAYIYEGQREMIDILQEQVHKQDAIIDAILGDGERITGLLPRSARGRSQRVINLLR